MSANRFSDYASSPLSPSAEYDVFASIGSTVDLPSFARQVYVGGAGNLIVRPGPGLATKTIACTAGLQLPIMFDQIVAGTTATNILVMY